MSKPVRLLVIDDSNYNRRTISGFFDDHPDVEVVGKAADGQEGLQMVNELEPTVITLDLEMPKLDGFSFLRLLMASRPTPVIILSAHSKRENVIKALELGVVDFVTKPDQLPSPSINDIRKEVIRKVTAAGKFNLNAIRNLSSSSLSLEVEPPAGSDSARESQAANSIVVIGASTGGPPAITRILKELPENLSAGIVVAQHMPHRFTTTFAQRLDKLCSLSVTEMRARDTICAGKAYIAAGDGDLVLLKTREGYGVKWMPPVEGARYKPSVDRLFTTAAGAAGINTLGIVLTGMGDDGSKGAKDIFEAGGRVLVESEETAAVYGMPAAVLESGIPARSRRLDQIARSIIHFCSQSSPENQP